MQRILKYFTQLTSRNDPASSMRWLMVVNFVLSSTLMWGVWMAMCLVKSQIVDIPSGLSNLYLAVNAMAISGKIVQTISENWTCPKKADQPDHASSVPAPSGR